MKTYTVIDIKSWCHDEPTPVRITIPGLFSKDDITISYSDSSDPGPDFTITTAGGH